jgi:type II secretory pathway component GspD/PulD (secretin)
MFIRPRWMVLATGVALAVCCARLRAQEVAASPDGPKVIVSSSGGATPTISVEGVQVTPSSGPAPAGPGGPSGSVQPKPPESGEMKKPDEGRPPGEGRPPAERGPGSDKKPGESPEKKDGAKGETPAEGSTKRPAEPPKPPDPKELEARPDEEGRVRFNFTGQPWPGVLQWLADISGMSLDWQELPDGYLNLTTQRSYTLEEARDLINRHLLARGYTMLFQGEVISVFKIDKLNPGMVPRVEPDELAARLPHEFVKVSFTLDWLLASNAVEELKPMLSPNGKLTALEATNRLEAMDAVMNLQQVYAVLKEEQSGTGQERLVREFALKNTRAKEVVEQLNTLLGIKAVSAPPMPINPQQMEQMQREAAMRAQQAKEGGKPAANAKPKAEVFLVANERKNSVVANAPPDKMAMIAQAIEILDMPARPENPIIENINRIQVYRLENIDPEAVVKSLKEMGSLDHRTYLEVDKENRAIVASASLVDHVTIRTLIDRLDQGSRHSVIMPLENLRAEVVAKQISQFMGGAEDSAQPSPERRGDGDFFNPFSPFGRSFSRPRGSQSASYEDKFRISADVKNNALVLWCNEFELKRVEDFLKQLELMPKSDGKLFEVRVYRLNTLDPEPLVKTLTDMDALGVHASLQADKASKSIVAYASAEDHAKIQELVDRLDSIGRSFEVVQLRRLQADSVAGTIQFMMNAAEEKSQSNPYDYYFPYFDRGRSSNEKKDSGFKIDADIENNRLLLLANAAEMAEVMNLLVKLGEIPPEEGDPSTLRVLDSIPGEELEKLLRQLEKVWPGVSPNPLILPEAGQKKSGDEGGSPPADRREALKTNTAAKPARAAVRFAQLETTSSGAAAGQAAAPRAAAADAKSGAGAESAATDGATRSANPALLEAAGGAEAAGKPETGKREEASSGGRPAVSVSVGADGRLVISSQDTRALDRLEQLLATLAPPHPDFQIFQLKYAWAYSVALTLEDIFAEKEKDQGRGRDYFFDYYYRNDNKKADDSLRLSKRRPLKFIADSQSNSVLVQNADPSQLRMIGDLIKFYDQPEPSDSQSIRKTEVFSVRYSKASIIAETVKDVYRDLLSSNDKALANAQQRGAAPERSYTYIYDASATEERKTPSFKGLLSLGVDDLSNTLIVSAPAYFIADVLKVIEALDKAAEPASETVEVLSLGDGVSAEHVQKTLIKILQQRAAGRPQGEGQRPQPQGEPRQGPRGPASGPRGR